MRFLILLAVFSVVGVGFSAVVKAPRANLNVGFVGIGDRLLARTNLFQQPIANAVQYQDYVFRGNAMNWITAVRATEVGFSQNAIATIISGGLGYNGITIRVQSARGRGYSYQIEIWGRYLFSTVSRFLMWSRHIMFLLLLFIPFRLIQQSFDTHISLYTVCLSSSFLSSYFHLTSYS